MSAETVPYVCDGIPGFVFRGLGQMVGPDLDHYRWQTEAHLRDVLATYMWFSGVESIRTEVQVPNCGRIDVMAEEGRDTYIIELKRSITTVSAARKAYQQAETYRLYVQAEQYAQLPADSLLYPRVEALVAAYEWDESAVALAERAFDDVHGSPYAAVLSFVVSWGFPDVLHASRGHAERRECIAARRGFVEQLIVGLDGADRRWANQFERTSLRDDEQVA